MEVIKTAIEGVVIIEPRIFKDARGYFFESFSQREFEEKVGPIKFVQDNESMSSYGVMRGLHFQRPPYTQTKLVRCVKGAVLDVAVDLRGTGHFTGSPDNGGTRVRIMWCVVTRRRLIALLRPVARWAHAAVMRAGEKGLRTAVAKRG